MSSDRDNPGLRWTTVLLAAVSLSIGWGIRGNFGHEYGAMLPGCLTAVAVCLLSGREDWRRRVPFFAMFGALGWGFGGSISYMQLISYTHSGHWASQVYGFASLFWVGFLWAALGGAGTALPAVADRERLTALFRPLCWVLAFWAALGLFGENLIERIASSYTATWGRHESPLYWFDSDWLQAVTALAALGCFDLWDRRGERGFALRGPLAAVFGAGGALAGFAAQWLIEFAGLTDLLLRFTLRYQGDTALFDPSRLVINWPQFFLYAPQHIGWLMGGALGLVVYFAVYGRFRSGASLFAHMGAGWLLGLLILPTLLGIRMTPPRSDDWAGITGLWVGTVVYLLRQGMGPVVYASVVSGVVGGVGFSGAALLKLVGVAPGNPKIVDDSAVVEAWAHWQAANWHSILEQSYGFINGIGVALAMGLLAARTPLVSDEPRVRKWTEGFSVFFALPFLCFLNLQKNPRTWVEASAMAERMTAPLFRSVALSAWNWHNLVFLALFAASIGLMVAHCRRPLALVPRSWLGRGQWLYLLLLWWMVAGNFERALPRFHEVRLVTEWVIAMNAILATVLLVALPREDQVFSPRPAGDFRARLMRVTAVGLLVAVTSIAVETGVVRLIYGDTHAGHSGRDGQPQMRFGPQAEWRVRPILKGEDHR